MISLLQRAEIRRLFYAEHWPIGTIADAVGVHHETVRRALDELEGAEEIVLVPGGLLGLLPLHAAWTPDNRRPTGRSRCPQAYCRLALPVSWPRSGRCLMRRPRC
jgi:hypothetical protein